MGVRGGPALGEREGAASTGVLASGCTLKEAPIWAPYYTCDTDKSSWGGTLKEGPSAAKAGGQPALTGDLLYHPGMGQSLS